MVDISSHINLFDSMKRLKGHMLISLHYSLLGLVTLMMIAGNSLPGIVVCHGDDGHISVEEEHIGACDRMSEGRFSDPNVGLTLITNEDHNDGQCRDIPIENHPHTRRKTVQNLHFPFHPSLTPSSMTILQLSIAQKSLPETHWPPPEFLENQLTGIIILTT